MDGNHGGPPGPSGGDNWPLDTVQAEQRRALSKTFVAMQGAAVQGNLVLVRGGRQAWRHRGVSSVLDAHAHQTCHAPRLGQLPAEGQPGAGLHQECSLAGVCVPPHVALRSLNPLLTVPRPTPPVCGDRAGLHPGQQGHRRAVHQPAVPPAQPKLPARPPQGAAHRVRGCCLLP